MDGQTSHWGFLESRTFNLAYWRGETELAEHTVILKPPICVPPGVGSNSYAPAYEALVTTPDVKFEFAGFRGYSYELWWSIKEGPATHIDVAGPTRDRKLTVATRLPRDGRVAWWYVERNNSAPGRAPGRSATYDFDLDAGGGRGGARSRHRKGGLGLSPRSHPRAGVEGRSRAAARESRRARARGHRDTR